MKKLLSIILATAMLISLIPAAFASDTEAEKGIKVVYDFEDKFVTDGSTTLYSTLTWEKNEGFWQYAANSYNTEEMMNSGGHLRVENNNVKVVSGPKDADVSGKSYYWIAFKINVPKEGHYSLAITANPVSGGKKSYIDAFIFKADDIKATELTDADIEKCLIDENNHLETSVFGADTGKQTLIFDGDKEPLEADEYFFVFKPSSVKTSNNKYTTNGYVFLNSLTLTEGDGSLAVPMYHPGEIEDIQLEVGDSKEVTGTMTHWSDGSKYDGEAVIYTGESGNDDVAVYENNKIVAKGAGNTTITVKSSDGYFVRDVNVKVVKQDEALTGAFIQEAAKENITNSYVAPTVTGTDFTGQIFQADDNGNGTFTLTAPEKNSDDKPFLYWAKGMETKKRIISFSNVINDYVPAENGRNYLIAVYEGDITNNTNEYYNLNGQLIAKQANAPADLPSIPGLGTAYDWEYCGGNVYVAKYADLDRDNVTVTVNGTEQTVAYGTEIPCTADVQDASGKPFKCWTKKGVNEEKAEIVSIDDSYSFYAWEDCTVEAVYGDHYYTGNNMKILIDSFDIATGVTGVMAEFIGLDNAVEKGIKFTDSKGNETKIPMTTTDNQLAVVADGAGTYTGYAILKEGNVYKMITGGSYRK